MGRRDETERPCDTDPSFNLLHLMKYRMLNGKDEIHGSCPLALGTLKRGSSLFYTENIAYSHGQLGVMDL